MITNMSLELHEEFKLNDEVSLTFKKHTTKTQTQQDMFSPQTELRMEPKPYELVEVVGQDSNITLCENCGENVETHTCHLQNPQNLIYYTCNICYENFQYAETLQQHMLLHEITGYPCHICSKSFMRKEHLRRHLMLHDSKSGEKVKVINKTIGRKGFDCHICDKKLSDKRWLKYHLLTKHSLGEENE